jgi:hypothetical protein
MLFERLLPTDREHTAAPLEVALKPLMSQDGAPFSAALALPFDALGKLARGSAMRPAKHGKSY